MADAGLGRTMRACIAVTWLAVSVVGLAACTPDHGRDNTAPSAGPVESPPSSVPQSSALQSAALQSAALQSEPPSLVGSAPSSAPSSVPSSAPSSAPRPSASPSPAIYHGRLTDTDGHPLKGYSLYWVYPGRTFANGLDDEVGVEHVVATTASDGTFQLPCDRAAGQTVAISPARIATNAKTLQDEPPSQAALVIQSGSSAIIPTIQIGRRCTTNREVTTVVEPSATLDGTLFINGQRWDATTAAGYMTAPAPIGPGSLVSLRPQCNAFNGEVELIEVIPDLATGQFTLSGVGAGDIILPAQLQPGESADASAYLHIDAGQTLHVVVNETMQDGEATAVTVTAAN
jgi:hypothetical protein